MIYWFGANEGVRWVLLRDITRHGMSFWDNLTSQGRGNEVGYVLTRGRSASERVPLILALRSVSFCFVWNFRYLSIATFVFFRENLRHWFLDPHFVQNFKPLVFVS